jgi:DNA replication and repair protein RecF
VRIHEIALQPYRNIDKLQLDLAADRILLVGENGKGKSNLLEAISYLSIGKSIRGSQDGQVVPHDGQYFDIEAKCQEGSITRHLRVYFSKKEGKRVFCDRSPLPRVSDLIGRFKTVHFSPEDVSMVMRFPAQRRRLLDILISQSDAVYLRDLQQYQRVLAQRNAQLRALRESRSQAGIEALEVWNKQLAHWGSRLRQRRLEVLNILDPLMANYYRSFSKDQEKAKMVYRWTGFNTDADEEKVVLTAENLKEIMLEDLKKKRDQEQQQGFTLVGPHRDQLVFTLDGVAADTYASEGQLKTLLVAWKMAEVEYLSQNNDEKPVLLLDDLFSELDQGRIQQVMEAMGGLDQVIMTTPQQVEEAERFGFSPINL